MTLLLPVGFMDGLNLFLLHAILKESCDDNVTPARTIILPYIPLEKGDCGKIGVVGRAGISSKFYKCGHLGGKGNKVLRLTMMVEVFHCE
jgi:hypothetical protein